MSRRVNLDAVCGTCGHRFEVSVFRSIWGEKPSNRKLVFDDEINIVKCPHDRSTLAEPATSELPLPARPEKSQAPGGSSQSIKALSLRFLFIVYIIGVVVSMPYFNWSYAKQNGFVDWLFLGEIVATSKAMIWPFYACAGATGNDRRDQTWAIFKESTERYVDALRVVNSKPVDQPLSEGQTDDLIRRLQSIYDGANRLSMSELDAKYAGLGAHYSGEFLPGLRSFISGLKTRSPDEVKRAQELLRRWVVYVDNNGEAIYKVFEHRN